MVCDEIREHLSEYLDGVLPPETKTRLDDHLSECAGCRKELESLKAVVRELNSLQPVDPPEDFLEQIHGKVSGRPWYERVIRLLFLPMKFKVPIQIAGALTAALLLFSILTLQHHETDRLLRPLLAPGPPSGTPAPEAGNVSGRPQMSQAPARPAQVRSRAEAEKAIDGRESSPSESLKVDEATGIGAIAEKQSIITLVLRIPRKPSSATQDKTFQKPEPQAERFTTKKEVLEDPLVHELKGLAARHRGQMLTAVYDERPGRVDSVVMEIPFSEYGSFSEDLKGLGAIEPSGSVPRQAEGAIKVRIKIAVSDK